MWNSRILHIPSSHANLLLRTSSSEKWQTRSYSILTLQINTVMEFRTRASRRPQTHTFPLIGPICRPNDKAHPTLIKNLRSGADTEDNCGDNCQNEIDNDHHSTIRVDIIDIDKFIDSNPDAEAKAEEHAHKTDHEEGTCTSSVEFREALWTCGNKVSCRIKTMDANRTHEYAHVLHPWSPPNCSHWRSPCIRSRKLKAKRRQTS